MQITLPGSRSGSGDAAFLRLFDGWHGCDLFDGGPRLGIVEESASALVEPA